MEFLVDELVVEARRGRLITCSGIKYPRGRRPINRAEAHKARLARGVKFASRKLKFLQHAARLANSHNFRMGCRIIRGSHTVRSPAHHSARSYDQSSEWPARAGAHVFQRQADCLAPKLFTRILRSHFVRNCMSS